LFFSSNINSLRRDGCRLEDRSGCDLWYAQIDWDQSDDTFTVNTVKQVMGSASFGYIFPSIYTIDKENGEYLLSVVQDDYDETGPYDRWDVVKVLVDVTNTPVTKTGVESILHAGWPDINSSGEYGTYVLYDSSDVPNVYRSALDEDYEHTDQVLYSDTYCDDDASDPHFLYSTSYTNYLLYHCPQGTDAEGQLVKRVGSTTYDQVQNEVIDDCGHFATTSDSDWAVCSSSDSGDSQIYYYDTDTVSGSKVLNNDNNDGVLIDADETFYDGIYLKYDGQTDIKQLYSTYGNSDYALIYTVNSDDGDISKIFLADADPVSGTVDENSDVFDLSYHIKEYLVDEGFFTALMATKLDLFSAAFDID